MAKFYNNAPPVPPKLLSLIFITCSRICALESVEFCVYAFSVFHSELSSAVRCVDSSSDSGESGAGVSICGW
ncbi:hypothetical protein DM860_013600 [Cuscuta australis]|uniref:Uncharacterized protein n=1 Tax=Cuscuta australis TaxID=267555 RepID=A0A328EAB7_9ASTE|nr:hypothetical protein DM860_013600 [Cuscuta australis]